MKTKMLLLLTVAICTLMTSVSFAAASEDVTVFGVTLGKSLQEVGIRDCTGRTVKDKCYSQSDLGRSVPEEIRCRTTVHRHLGFPADINVDPLVTCDATSDVLAINTVFNAADYEKVLSLLTGQFGTPTNTEKTDIRGRRGAKREQVTALWDLGGHRIYLTNRSNSGDKGLLTVF